MLDHLKHGSNSFDMQIAEPMFEFCLSLPIPVAINSHHWNCCFGSMTNILYMMHDTESKDFFSMNMDNDWPWMHQKLVEKNNKLFCKSTDIFQILQTVLIHLFGYSIFSFRKLTFNKLKQLLGNVSLQCYFSCNIFIVKHKSMSYEYFQVLNVMRVCIKLMKHIQNA